LKAVRLLVTVEARRGWGAIVRGLPAQCGAVLVVPPAGSSRTLGGSEWSESAVAVLRQEWRGVDDGRRLMGVDVSAPAEGSDGDSALVRAAAAELLPDIIVETRPTPGWPHEWALHGVVSSGAMSSDGPLAQALADDAVSLCLFQARFGDAAPVVPESSKPWFAVVGGLDEARLAVAAGATKLAWRCAGRTLFGRLKPPVGDMVKASDLLAEAWRKAHPDRRPTGRFTFSPD